VSAQHDTIAPDALPAIEALEALRGDASAFAQAEAELRRLIWRGDFRQFLSPLLLVPALLVFDFLGPAYGISAFAAAAVVGIGFQMWWTRTPRARAIKRVRRAIIDWLAFAPAARHT